MSVYCSEMICCNFELGRHCEIRLYLKKCFVLKLFGELEDIDVIEVNVIQKRTLACSNKVKKMSLFHMFSKVSCYFCCFMCYFLCSLFKKKKKLDWQHVKKK